jgi:hypothetical protein
MVQVCSLIEPKYPESLHTWSDALVNDKIFPEVKEGVLPLNRK